VDFGYLSLQNMHDDDSRGGSSQVGHLIFSTAPDLSSTLSDLVTVTTLLGSQPKKKSKQIDRNHERYQIAYKGWVRFLLVVFSFFPSLLGLIHILPIVQFISF